MSLLEVGAGFHPELTARENVFLNGAILGLSKASVQSKFDGIVALAGVARFFDTPVKRFSSGMKVRLAVAIGLHLDSRLTILDEVLAVGDAEFQRQCLQALDAMSTVGDRAIMLVSHNMATIQQVCQRVLVMQQGRLVFDGDPRDAVAKYFHQVAGGAPVSHPSLTARTIRMDRSSCVTCGSATAMATQPLLWLGGLWAWSWDLDLSKTDCRAHVDLRFHTRDRQLLAVAGVDLDQISGADSQSAQFAARFTIDSVPLAAGQYSLSVDVTSLDGTPLDAVESVLTFVVTDVSKPAGALTTGLVIPHVLLQGDWGTCSPPLMPRSSHHPRA